MIDMESLLNLAFLLGKQHFNLKYVCKDMIGQLNNCSELIKFIIEELNDYKYNVVKFQGEAIEVTTTTLDYIDIGVIKGRCLITLSKSAEGAFDLHCIHGIVHFNKQYPCVVVPNYVKEELLDALASYKA